MNFETEEMVEEEYEQLTSAMEAGDKTISAVQNETCLIIETISSHQVR